MQAKVSRTAEGLETLRENTVFIEINTKSGENYALFKDYLAKHRSALKAKDTSSPAYGSFNDFLTVHFEKQHPGKVVVAKITGTLSDTSILENADLSGCSFVDLRIEHGELENVSFRDACMTNVVFEQCRMTNVDFRGAKVQNCQFEDFGLVSESSLTEMQFSMHDPISMQRKGLFAIRDEFEIEKQMKVVRDNVNKELAEKEQVLREKIERAKKKHTSFLSGLSKKGAQFIEIFEQRIAQELEKAKKEIELHENFVRSSAIVKLTKVATDPTYIPNQNALDAGKKREAVKATREDLEKYLESGMEGSFKDFMVKEPKDGVFYYVDMSGQDISGLNLAYLDLSRVNFAKCIAVGTNFAGANVSGSCFEEANLSGADFTKADATDAKFMAAFTEGDAPVIFNKAILTRAQMQVSQFAKGQFNGAVAYAIDAMGMNAEGASMVEIQADHADFSKANLSYIDARYAKMRYAVLEEAMLKEADLTEADLTGAQMKRVEAEKVKLVGATLEEVQARYANLRGALLENLQAKKGDFTGAFMDEANAELAILEKAIFDGVSAQKANFTGATMRDMSAKLASFEKATMDGIAAERIDLQGAILKQASLKKAIMENAVLTDVNAQGADFEGAVLNGIKAMRADFTKAMLEGAKLRKAQLQQAKLSKANMKGADLEGADISGAHVIGADLGGAKVQGLKFDETTVIAFSNLTGLTGDQADALRKHQDDIVKNIRANQWFDKSRYDNCTDPKSRLAAQKLGAQVITIALSGGFGAAVGGVYPGGMLGGLTGLAAAAFLTPAALEALINAQNKADSSASGAEVNLEFLNSTFGDKLAEVGVIAHSMGIDVGNVDEHLARTICTSMGVFSRIGIKASYRVGASMLRNNRVSNYFFGYSSQHSFLSTSVAVGRDVLGELIKGGGYILNSFRVTQVVKDLYNYEINSKGEKIAGKTPEEIWVENKELYNEIKKKFTPTQLKVIVAISCAILASLTVFAIPFALVYGYCGATTAMATIPALVTPCIYGAGVGGVYGYLHGHKVQPVVDCVESAAERVRSAANYLSPARLGEMVGYSSAIGQHTQALEAESSARQVPAAAMILVA